MSCEVHLLPALKDNYIAVVRDAIGAVAVIDPSEARPAIAFFERHAWRPDFILNTHHHWDHVGGNLELMHRYGCPLLASEIDGAKIKGVTQFVADGDTLPFGEERIRAIAIPGHTLGHTGFYFEKSRMLFSGDTLFSTGCGRLFEGTAPMMWASLGKLLALPDDTRIYCGHEYTVANARFALAIEPHNQDILTRQREAESQQARGLPTLPTTLAMEKRTNPFLRAGEASVRSRLGFSAAAFDVPNEVVFARLREMKDQF